MEIKRLTREDLADIINSPALKIEDVIKVAKDEYDVDVQIPEGATPKEAKEAAIDQIFDAYNAALIEIESNKYQQKAEKRTNTRKPKKADGQPSRKQAVIGLIGEGTYTKEALVAKMDADYGYAAAGKTSKTRVSKVIRELKKSNSLIEAADGTLSLKGA